MLTWQISQKEKYFKVVYNITKQAGGERNNDKNNMYSVLEVTRSHKLSKITENEDLMPKQNSIESNKQNSIVSHTTW